MNLFSVNCQDIATGAVAGTFKTFIGIKASNTTGYRGRLRELEVGPAGEAPQDLNVDITLIRSDNTSDGTSTAQTPSQIDNNSRASIMTAGVNYTVEPTTIATVPMKIITLNGRSTGIWQWGIDDSPKWGSNQTFLIRLAPGTNVAIKFSINATFEEW